MKPLNTDMPDRRTDPVAYKKERRQRIRNYTWVFSNRGSMCGYKRSRERNHCADCRAYNSGYWYGIKGNRTVKASRPPAYHRGLAAGYAAYGRNQQDELYADDPFMGSLLP